MQLFAIVSQLILYSGCTFWVWCSITLPGMAGLVLTIGMAVDANVLIFERIKEELASGKGFKLLYDMVIKRALTSIIDANVTTLLQR